MGGGGSAHKHLHMRRKSHFLAKVDLKGVVSSKGIASRSLMFLVPEQSIDFRFSLISHFNKRREAAKANVCDAVLGP